MSKTPFAKPKPKSVDVVKRLSAPTTLAYELGAIGFATLAVPLILLGMHAMGR